MLVIRLPYRNRRSSFFQVCKPEILEIPHSTIHTCFNWQHDSRPLMPLSFCCMMLSDVRLVNNRRPFMHGKLYMNISTCRTLSGPRFVKCSEVMPFASQMASNADGGGRLGVAS